MSHSKCVSGEYNTGQMGPKSISYRASESLRPSLTYSIDDCPGAGAGARRSEDDRQAAL